MRSPGLLFLAAAFFAALLAPARAEEKPEPPKPASRTVRNIEGWTVRVADRLLQGSHEAIPDVADFVSPRHNNEQPWVVLHELAHGYHNQVLGFDEARILKAWERYKDSGHGDSVLSISGKRRRHYALTDQKEFFAEMSEAYFGMNDFFPFNRAELKVEEPEIFELLQTIWGPVAASNKPAQAKVP